MADKKVGVSGRGKERISNLPNPLKDKDGWRGNAAGLPVGLGGTQGDRNRGIGPEAKVGAQDKHSLPTLAGGSIPTAEP